MEKMNCAAFRRGLAAASAVLLLLSTLPLYAIAFYNHPYYDDYGFSAGVHQAWQETGSLAAVWKAAMQSAAETRQNWQGTYTGTLFSNLQPGLFSESIYWIGNFFLLSTMIVCFAFFFAEAFGRLGLGKSDRITLSCLALTVMIQFMPDVGEAFYWFNGGVGNVFIYALLALGAALSIRLFACSGRGVALTAALAVVAVMMGGGSYGGGLFGLCLCALTLIWLFVRRHAKRWIFLLMTFVYLGCFLYSMAAPGNSVRAGIIAYNSSPVKAIVQAMYYGTAQIGSYIRLPLIAVTLLMLPALYEAAKASRFSFAHPWLVLGTGVCLYCTQLVPPLYSGVFIGGGRIVNTYFLSFVTMWFFYAYYLAGFAARKTGWTLRLDRRRCAALILVCACLFGVGSLAYKRSADVLYGIQNLSGPSAALSLISGEAEQYDHEMTAREVLLNDHSKPVITLAPLSSVPAVFMDDLLHVGAVYDARPSLCMYYGKETIYLEGEAGAQ